MDYISHILAHPPKDVERNVFVDADDPARTITWQQHIIFVKRLAVGLRRLGVAEQECVALIAPNEIYTGVLADAVLAAGAIFTGCYATAKHAELVHSFDAAEVKWIFATPPIYEKALAAAQDANIEEQRVLLFDPPGTEYHPCRPEMKGSSFSSLLQAHTETFYANPNEKHDPSTRIAFRYFTSGTTGAPKAANTSHQSCVSRSKQLMGGAHDSKEETRNLHFVGMHHVSGLSGCQQAVTGNQCMFISNAEDPTSVIDLIQRHQITRVLLPPRSLIAITETLQRRVRTPEAIQSLKNVVVGGTSIADDSLDAFRALLPPTSAVRVAYGSTEVGGVSAGDWDKNPRIPGLSGFVGFITPYSEVKLIDPETGKECGPNSDGEVCVRGEQMFLGYCGNEAATKAAFFTDLNDQKWFRMGDKGRQTVDGALYITGRYKEIFKVATEEIAPAEVEALLKNHSAVQDVAITPVQDRNDAHYSEVKAWIVKEEGKEVSPQELVDYVATELSKHKAPTGGVAFVSNIPRSPLEKVVRRKLDEEKLLPGSVEYLDISD